MSKISWKGGAVLAPLPCVLVSCAHGETKNILTIAWTGIINTKEPKTYIAVRKERFSYDLIKNSGEFVINLPSADLVRAVDFCGVKSGKDMDKATKTGLIYDNSSQVKTPLIKNCPINLECRVKEIVELGSHDMFIADIVAVDVDEAVVDKKGKLIIEKCNLMAYAHGTYFKLGESIGSFGYSVKKKKSKKPKKS